MKVRCLDAKESGIPIREGEIYTVRTSFVGPPPGVPCEAEPGYMSDVPGYALVDVPGYFRANRFEVVQ